MAPENEPHDSTSARDQVLTVASWVAFGVLLYAAIATVTDVSSSSKWSLNVDFFVAISLRNFPQYINRRSWLILRAPVHKTVPTSQLPVDVSVIRTVSERKEWLDETFADEGTHLHTPTKAELAQFFKVFVIQLR